MRTLEEYQQILKMNEDGYSHNYISKLLNISRFTIKEVINNPEVALARGKDKSETFPSIEELSAIIAKSISLAEVLKSLNMSLSGNNHRVLKQLIDRNNIDTKHFLGKGHKKTVTKLIEFNTIPIESILVEKSTYQTSKLSKRLLDEKLLDYKCSECGLTDQWNGKEITLQIDHINGVSDDHRINNLRFLCPNCHSQTSTYCGRNAKKSFSRIKIRQPSKRQKQIYHCPKCNAQLADKRASQCRKCSKEAQFKTTYPSPEELINLIKEIGYVQVGKQLGVSDNAIRKHLKNRGYQLP